MSRVILSLVLAAAAALLGATPATAERPGREPIVFVHGLFGSTANFDTMSLRFRLNGYARSELVAFGYDSTGSLLTAANSFAAQVDRVLAATGADKVDVGCVSHVDLVSNRAVFDQVRQAVTG